MDAGRYPKASLPLRTTRVWLYGCMLRATLQRLQRWRASLRHLAPRYPRLHYLLASMSPLYDYADLKVPVSPVGRPVGGRWDADARGEGAQSACVQAAHSSRGIDTMFSDAFSREHQLLKARSAHVACTHGSALKERPGPLRSASARFGASGPWG